MILLPYISLLGKAGAAPEFIDVSRFSGGGISDLKYHSYVIGVMEKSGCALL